MTFEQSRHSNPSVLLTQCAGYQSPELRLQVRRVLESLIDGGLGQKTVLLKPNLISSRGPSLACTSGAFIREVACFCLENGARVKIGDSPAFGSTHSVMERHGILQQINDLPVDIVQFTTPVLKVLPDGRELSIAAESQDCDLLVNLPRLKAHNQLYLTCAVKNFFGTVVGLRKPLLHMSQGQTHDTFAMLLLALPSLFLNHITLVDAVDVMHRSGPLDGERLFVGCIAGSRCPVALDTVLMHILGVEPSKNPILRAAVAAGYAGSSLASCSFPLEEPTVFGRINFIPPDSLNPIRFNPFRLMVSAIKRMVLANRR